MKTRTEAYTRRLKAAQKLAAQILGARQAQADRIAERDAEKFEAEAKRQAALGAKLMPPSSRIARRLARKAGR